MLAGGKRGARVIVSGERARRQERRFEGGRMELPQVYISCLPRYVTTTCSCSFSSKSGRRYTPKCKYGVTSGGTLSGLSITAAFHPGLRC